MLKPNPNPILLIDIDGTVINEMTPAQRHARPHLHNHTLLAIMRDVAVAQRGYTADEAEACIDRVFQTHVWWTWQDYLDALGLDTDMFWRHALTVESAYLQPLPGVAQTLRRLADQGYRLWVASNNPIDGIRHKIRLAGLDQFPQHIHFEGLLGTNVVEAMKWDPVFWQRAIHNFQLSPEHITTIGDNWHDDICMPAQAGIGRHLHMSWDRNMPSQSTPPGSRVRVITGWDQVENALAMLSNQHATVES